MTELFRLRLSSAGPGMAQVRVEQSRGGEPHQEVALPFDAATARALLLLLEKGDLEHSRLDASQLSALTALGLVQEGHLLGPEARNRLIGQRLYATLFPSGEQRDQDVRRALYVALGQTQEAVALQLLFDQNETALAALPWELILDESGHLVASERLRLTRYITFGEPTTPFPVTDRLEALVITSRPEDAPTLDPEAERQALTQAFQQVEAQSPQLGHHLRVDHLQPPTLDALIAAVNRHSYHIVHFDGHGDLARRCPFCQRLQRQDLAFCTNPNCENSGGPLDEHTLVGCLAFERSESNRVSQLVSTPELANALAQTQVRLFVASACQSATVQGPSVFGSVGPGLINAGVPAVVAMQFSVPLDSAVAFVGEFYAALARGESIAAATAAGRRILHPRGTWYIPAVYLRSQDGEGALFRFEDRASVHGELLGGGSPAAQLYLLPAGAGPVDWEARRPPEAAPFKPLSPHETLDKAVFFGREQETRTLAAEVLHQRLVVLHGPAGVGKTSLVNAGLIPALLEKSYLVLRVGEYGASGDDLLARLRQAVAAAEELEVELGGADNLHGLIEALLREVGRPLVLVLDEFDEFLRSRLDAERAAFATQLAAVLKASYPLPVCLLLVVRQDALRSLSELDPNRQESLGSRVALELMSPSQAEDAIVQPLARHRPPLTVDLGFLQNRLLPDLCAETEGASVHPTYLQIVCDELYRAALRTGARGISAALYPTGGIATLLERSLQQRLEESVPDPAEREMAKKLLGTMVSGTGSRAFVTAAQAAASMQAEPSRLPPLLDTLLDAGLLELRPGGEEAASYSLSHRVLAPLVSGWSDPERALDLLAERVLNRAWEDWHAQWELAQRSTRPTAERSELLVAPDRLREIQQRRAGLRLTGPHLCLLLRSAVRHQAEAPYWAQQLRKDERARVLLQQLHGGPGDAPPEVEAARLAGAALGLQATDLGHQALARAAVSGSPTVAHAAALALAALDGDALEAATQQWSQPAPLSTTWRRARALAQIKAAGFSLPELKPSQWALVRLWLGWMRLWQARTRLLLAAVGGALGGASGLMLPLALVLLAIGYRDAGEIAAPLLVGGVIGVCFAVGRVVLSLFWPRRAGRIVGGALGFALGLLLLSPFIPQLNGGQLLAALVAGAAVAAGPEWLALPKRRLSYGRIGLGGALAGALSFAATAGAAWRLPFLLRAEFLQFLVPDPSWLVLLVVALAAFTGAMMGGGLVVGSVAGEALGRRLAQAGLVGEGAEPEERNP